jgi:hypothetical protein
MRAGLLIEFLDQGRGGRRQGGQLIQRPDG